MPKTKVVKIEKTLGKLNGAGKGIDFFAVALVKTDLTLEELEDSVESLVFRRINGKKMFSEIEILPAGLGGEVESRFLEYDKLTFDYLKNCSDVSGYYYVSINDGYLFTFDIRGS
ncbi:MAG: hypothetical protein LBM38_06565 [Clostridiales bacterium]|nr:hypothetical protein [Clostridiales bacterium]